MAAEREPADRFTDEEAAFLRHVRFGELPPRAQPDEWVELAETDLRQAVAEPPPEVDVYGYRRWGAGA